MRIGQRRQRGLMLAMVMMIMAMISGILLVVATCSVNSHRDRQGECVRRVKRALTSSAVVYARQHLGEWSVHPPNDPIVLDVSALVPERMKGSAQVSFETTEAGPVCCVTVRAERFGIATSARVDLAMQQEQ